MMSKTAQLSVCLKLLWHKWKLDIFESCTEKICYKYMCMKNFVIKFRCYIKCHYKEDDCNMQTGKAHLCNLIVFIVCKKDLWTKHNPVIEQQFLSVILNLGDSYSCGSLIIHLRAAIWWSNSFNFRFDKLLYLGVAEDNESQRKILSALTRK